MRHKVFQPLCLAPMALLGFLSLFADQTFALFYCFGAFSLWGHGNKWLRAISFLGFLGPLGLVGFIP